MERSPRPRGWLASCCAFLLSATTLVAWQLPHCHAQPGSCQAACPCPPKIVVHLPAPDVVYDGPDDGCCEKRPHSFFHKHCKRPAAPTTITTASVLTPLQGVASGAFFGQTLGVGLNAVSLNGANSLNGFGTQSVGGDLYDIRAAQELELMAARVASMQASRDAEARIQAASLQRIQAQLSGISNGLTASLSGTRGGTFGTQGATGTPQMQQDMTKLQQKVEDLEKKLQDVADLCNRIGVRLKDK